MKKHFFKFKFVGLVFSLFLISTLTYAGGKKGFKGTITYAITYEGEEFTPAQRAQMPKTQTTKIMDNLQKDVVDFGMGAQYTITNPNADSYTVMFEMGENKRYVTKSLKEHLAKQDSVNKANFDITIDFINETKVIAGVECKKAIITLTPKDTAMAQEQSIVAYYSPELGSKELNNGDIFAGIDGLLLEYTVSGGNYVMKFSATEIKKGGVSALDFMIPSDFKELTKEELEKEGEKEETDE